MTLARCTLVTIAICTALAAVSFTAGPAAAFARPAEQSATAPVIKPPQRQTPSPKPTATPSASTSPAVATVACAYPTVKFNGTSYCPGTIVGIRNTAYGIGTRVVLNGVTVTTITTSTVTVAAWTSPPCPPGKYCGAILTLESLIVPWSGTSRPAYGDVLSLFLTTTSASGKPVGYLKTGYCPIDWC